MNNIFLFYSLLLTYSVTLTIIFIVDKKKNDNNNRFIELKNIIRDSELDREKKINFYIEFEKLIATKTPWYLKSISAIGVVAFVSMVAATSVQTINATYENYKSKQLEEKLNEIKKKEIQANKVITNVTDIIFDLYSRTGILPDNSDEILKYRFNYLEKINKLEQEAYNIAMLRGDYKNAIKILRISKSNFSNENPIDQISLAQYYYLIGDMTNSLKLIKKAKKQISKLPPYWQIELTVIEYLLDVNNSKNLDFYLRRISNLLKINEKQAELRLLKISSKLKNAVIN